MGKTKPDLLVFHMRRSRWWPRWPRHKPTRCHKDSPINTRAETLMPKAQRSLRKRHYWGADRGRFIVKSIMSCAWWVDTTFLELWYSKARGWGWQGMWFRAPQGPISRLLNYNTSDISIGGNDGLRERSWPPHVYKCPFHCLILGHLWNDEDIIGSELF